MRRGMIIGLVLVAWLAVAGASALAEPVPSFLPPPAAGLEAVRQPGGTPLGGQTDLRIPWGRLIWGTALVVGLVLGGAYAVKVMGGRRMLGGRHLEMVETRQVGRRMQLILVRVAGRLVLVGATGESMTRLAVFDEPDAPEPEPEPSPAPQAERGFHVLLKKLAGVTR